MRELLEYLARALVEDPAQVSVEEFEEDDGTIVRAPPPTGCMRGGPTLR